MSEKRLSRPRFSALSVLFSTMKRTLGALFRFRMLSLIPLVLLLFVIALLLMALATTGPLAPFIYPLI